MNQQQRIDHIRQCLQQGRLEEATSLASEGVAQAPDDPELNKLMGVCRFSVGDFSGAQGFFSKALEHAPEDANCLNNLGSCLLYQHRPLDAAPLFWRALQQGQHPNWLLNLGQAYLELGLYRRAAAVFKQIADGGAVNDALLLKLIHCLKHASDFEQALEYVSRLTDPGQQYVEKLAVLVELNRPQQVRQLLQQPPTLTDAQWQQMHNVYRFLGDKQGEQKVVAHFCQGQGEQALLARAMRQDLDDLQLEELEKAIDEAVVSESVRATLYFLLAAQYKRRDKAKWFELLRQANNCQLAGHAVAFEPYQQDFDNIVAGFARYQHLRSPIDSDRPIFIVGMPRSGTTLVESILANHEHVFAAGESTLAESLLMELNPALPSKIGAHGVRLHYLEGQIEQEALAQFATAYLTGLKQYSREHRFVTDKMPHNFLHLGILATAFPNAKFIHCVRHPVATCLSIYEQNFSHFHRYGNDLHCLGRYYLAYQSLMAFWKAQLGPQRLLDISYEALVQEPERQSERLLEFLGLPPQAGLLALERSQRTVTTSSLAQVRQGIYTDSLMPHSGLESQLAALGQQLMVQQRTPATASPRSWWQRLLGRG